MEMDKVKVKQVIICSKKRRGRGKIPSPIRVITEVLDFDGNLIAEDDPSGGYTPETILDFLKWKYKSVPEDEHIENIRDYFLSAGEQ